MYGRKDFLFPSETTTPSRQTKNECTSKHPLPTHTSIITQKILDENILPPCHHRLRSCTMSARLLLLRVEFRNLKKVPSVGILRQSPPASVMCDPSTSETANTMKCNHVCMGTSTNVAGCLLNAVARAVVHQSSVLSTDASRLKLSKDLSKELESKLCKVDTSNPRTLQDLSLRIEQFATSKKGVMSGLLGNTKDAVSKMENALVDSNAWAESERNRLAVKLVELYDSDFQAHCSKECANEDELFEHKMECRFLPVSCENEGCPESFALHLRDKHDSHCSFKLVPCTLNCNQIVMRREMCAHQVGTCSMKLMKCPYFDLGCVDPICKGVLHQHVTTNADSHLKMLWAEEAKVKSRVLELERWSAALAEDDDKRRAGLGTGLNVRPKTPRYILPITR
jgi:hypothetical protein